MRIKILTPFVVAAIAAIISASCNSPQKNTTETQTISTDTTVAVVTTDTLAQARKDWESFKTDANEKIKQNNDSIDAFNAKMDKAGKKMHAKYEKRVEQMKERNEALKAKLNDFKEEGKEKWDKFKYDFKRDMDTIDIKWKELTKQDKG